MKQEAFVGAGPSRPFVGSIDHAMIWNRGLSVTEINMLYQDPYQLFRKKRTFLKPIVSGGARIIKHWFMH
jgi:hypothetical protein